MNNKQGTTKRVFVYRMKKSYIHYFYEMNFYTSWLLALGDVFLVPTECESQQEQQKIHQNNIYTYNSKYIYMFQLRNTAFIGPYKIAKHKQIKAVHTPEIYSV
jgi:hypothetical protein